MRQQHHQHHHTNNYDDLPLPHQSPSEIPTLPLRGNSRGNNQNYIYYSQQSHNDNDQQSQLDLSLTTSRTEISPSKMTRF